MPLGKWGIKEGLKKEKRKGMRAKKGLGTRNLRGSGLEHMT